MLSQLEKQRVSTFSQKRSTEKCTGVRVESQAVLPQTEMPVSIKYFISTPQRFKPLQGNSC